MKIYTRKGDHGETGLIGGTRVMKDHARIEAYGTLDELNSFIGVLRDSQGTEELKSELIYIQEELFTIGSHLANDPEKSKMTLPGLDPEIISKLENWMDKMDDKLEPMRNFILPGGHITVSHC
ncbi:MAG: cob(I)yrinic acid a,c-diamide adenosyltransferase, partial [Bacteroidota bacterium]